MKIITRSVAIKNLKKYVGKDLKKLAFKYGITVYKNGKQNKGWKGLTLERLAGLQNNVSKAPNGLSWELKSVSFYNIKGKLAPKETMAITMINPRELKEENFFESHCWAKLKSIIFCAVFWHGKNARTGELICIENLDFAEDDKLIKEIQSDYELIRDKLIKRGFKNLTGKDGKWIQARTKGKGHGSITRAFYARKNLVRRIFDSQ